MHCCKMDTLHNVTLYTKCVGFIGQKNKKKCQSCLYKIICIYCFITAKEKKILTKMPNKV